MPDLREYSDSVALLVSSCDAFFDAWKPFAQFFEKFWSDCPLPCFLLSNELAVRSRRWQSLAVGPDRGWSSNLLVALERIPQRYVLYFQEDYFLTDHVRSEQLAADFAAVCTRDTDSLCFRARSEPDPGTEPLNDRFGLAPLASDGRSRCQVTLWKKSALQSILRAGETAWDFEARGSARTQEMQILTYLRRENTPVPYLMSAISRGFWMPEAVALCRANSVRIDPFFRPVFSETSWRRRWRRAVGRRLLARALRAQLGRPIEL